MLNAIILFNILNQLIEMNKLAFAIQRIANTITSRRGLRDHNRLLTDFRWLPDRENGSGSF